MRLLAKSGSGYCYCRHFPARVVRSRSYLEATQRNFLKRESWSFTAGRGKAPVLISAFRGEPNGMVHKTESLEGPGFSHSVSLAQAAGFSSRRKSASCSASHNRRQPKLCLLGKWKYCNPSPKANQIKRQLRYSESPQRPSKTIGCGS